jgi:hypothetical protein
MKTSQVYRNKNVVSILKISLDKMKFIPKNIHSRYRTRGDKLNDTGLMGDWG